MVVLIWQFFFTLARRRGLPSCRQEIMVGGKLAWQDGGKPSDAKGGYDLGCQQLACHVGWPGPAPPLLLKFTSEMATSSVTTGFPNI